MVIRTYFTKNNTIIRNSDVNTALNPVTELFYGGSDGKSIYSRFIFDFDLTRLREHYNSGLIKDLSKLKHTLRMTNTQTLDENLIGKGWNFKDRATSFDLIVFEIPQPWDSGVGYDYSSIKYLNGNPAFDNRPSNWIWATTTDCWGGDDCVAGIYDVNNVTQLPDIRGRQHFDKGNENIEIDITDLINELIVPLDTYYIDGEPIYKEFHGLGIAFDFEYERMQSDIIQYVGFFTNNTQTFYEPHIETVYSEVINDERNNFINGKENTIYLYVNAGGKNINLDENPIVTIYDDEDEPITSIEAENVSIGVYKVTLKITNPDKIDHMFYDVWSNIIINGEEINDIKKQFVLQSENKFYDFDECCDNNSLALSVSGVKSGERIVRGDIRKIDVSARIPYTMEQTYGHYEVFYRLYVKEGKGEFTIIDYQPINKTNKNMYFLIDTESLLPNTYYLDLKLKTNFETKVLTNQLKFDIINQVEYRNK